MATQPMVKLSDGNRMPQLGLGVWQASDAQVTAAVDVALQTGYRSIDNAAIYGNEASVGAALKNAKIPRNDLFLTTKVWVADNNAVERALAESLTKLHLDYLDLYLIHWPAPATDSYVNAWKEMIRLQKQGLIKSIGVCNFNPPHIERLIGETGVTPVINQVELHPLLQQKSISEFNATHHIVTEAWSPLAHGGEGVFDTPIVQQLAQKHGKSPAQIVIRWQLECNRVVIPKSVTPSRIKENFDVFSFSLSKEEIAELAKLDCGKRIGPNPETFNG